MGLRPCSDAEEKIGGCFFVDLEGRRGKGRRLSWADFEAEVFVLLGRSAQILGRASRLVGHEADGGEGARKSS